MIAPEQKYSIQKLKGEGFPQRQIAEQLNISKPTVASHCKAVEPADESTPICETAGDSEFEEFAGLADLDENTRTNLIRLAIDAVTERLMKRLHKECPDCIAQIKLEGSKTALASIMDLGLWVDIGGRQDTVQTSVNASCGCIPCRLCEKEFTPKRRNQTFCSPACRKRYYGTAYRIGSFLLDVLKRDNALVELLTNRDKGK